MGSNSDEGTTFLQASVPIFHTRKNACSRFVCLCFSVCLVVYLCVCLSIYPFPWASVSLCVSASLPVCVFLSLCLCVTHIFARPGTLVANARRVGERNIRIDNRLSRCRVPTPHIAAVMLISQLSCCAQSQHKIQLD